MFLVMPENLPEAGRQPLALVGGATGLIGVPTKAAERKLMPKILVQDGWIKSANRWHRSSISTAATIGYRGQRL
ncbi:hypothetical protein ACNKHQ_09625 [Shigella flexneri]